MTPVLISNLVIAVFLWGAQLMLRPSVYGERGRTILLRIARLVFWVLIVGGFFLASYLTYQQYNLWLTHPISRLLLPPNQNISYFVYYAINNFYLATILASLAALAILLTAHLLSKKFQDRFFETAEPYLIGSSILLVGHPGWLLYIPAVLFGGLIVLLIRNLRSRNHASFYYFWLPAAALAIMISRVIVWFKYPTIS